MANVAEFDKKGSCLRSSPSAMLSMEGGWLSGFHPLKRIGSDKKAAGSLVATLLFGFRDLLSL